MQVLAVLVFAVLFFTGWRHGKWENQLNFSPDENPWWQVWWHFKGKVTSGHLNVTGNTHYQQGCRSNTLKFRVLAILMINIQVYKLKCTTFYDKKKEKEKSLILWQYRCFLCLLMFVCLVVIIRFSPHCTDPCVYSYISDDHIPKHTITAMFFTLHSCFKELIFFIFFSLVWSKANMLNLFQAFQSDDGKASGIALG